MSEKRKRGRPPIGASASLVVRLEPEMLAALDAARRQGESRVALIRAAIAAEIARRARE